MNNNLDSLKNLNKSSESTKVENNSLMVGLRKIFSNIYNSDSISNKEIIKNEAVTPVDSRLETPQLNNMNLAERSQLPPKHENVQNPLIKFAAVHQKEYKKLSKNTGGGGFKWFLIKVLLASGTVYGTKKLNVWGSPSDSEELVAKLKDQLGTGNSSADGPNKISSLVVGKYNNTVKWFGDHVQELPETLLEIYKKNSLLLKEYYKKASDFVRNRIKPDDK